MTGGYMCLDALHQPPIQAAQPTLSLPQLSPSPSSLPHLLHELRVDPLRLAQLALQVRHHLQLPPLPLPPPRPVPVPVLAARARAIARAIARAVARAVAPAASVVTSEGQ